jgi:hypothetical protein
MSTAYSEPSIDPKYAVPETIAAEDSIESFAWKLHRNRSVEGSEAPLIPIRAGDPRNIGQSAFVSADEAKANTPSSKEIQLRMTNDE